MMGSDKKKTQASTASRKEREQHAQGFFAFLKDGKYFDAHLQKTQMKNIYTMLYTPQYYPTVLPDFEGLTNTMQSLEMFKMGSDGRITFQQKWAPASKKQSSARAKGQTKSPSKGHGAVHLAVDQRVALGTQKKHVLETSQDTDLWCQICRVTFQIPGELEMHRAGSSHRRKYLIHWYSNNKKTLVQDKNNTRLVVVQPEDHKYNKEEGLISVAAQTNKQKTIVLKCENNGSTKVVIRHVEALCQNSTFHLHDEHGVTAGRKFVEIPPGLYYTIEIHCQNEFVGQYKVPVAFQLRQGDKYELFHILREVIFLVQTPGLEDLYPTAPFKRPSRIALSSGIEETVPGLPLPKKASGGLESVIQLKKYVIPVPLNRLLNHGLKTYKGISDEDNVTLQDTLKLLKEGLTLHNYSRYFSLLLHIEEHQMSVDIHHYDMQDVTMKPFPEDKKLLILNVPGLAENRPSVLRGDRLFVVIKEEKMKNAKTKEYEGIVHATRENECVIGFSTSFREKFLPNMKFDVRFTFNRYPIQNMHRSVAMASELSLEKFIFPVTEVASTCPPLCDSSLDLLPFNRLLQDNKEQRQAVRHIVAGSSRPAPYLVFGPPGTGKTVTVVEAMKQIWKKYSKSHILACAPSNSASDLLAQRLLEHVPKSQILRFFASSRDWTAVPDNLRDCCNYDKKGSSFTYPPKAELMKFKIVVTTLVNAGRIVTANFPQNHFTHVFIDECGHAMEPEAMIAVAGILETATGSELGGQLVLAGDPKQLGPVLRSPIVLKNGLDKSLLERLMIVDLYKKDDSTNSYNPQVLTKLLKNFRSHRAILKMPSQLFYDDELQEAANPLLSSIFCDWDLLPKKGFPMFFHAVIGKDQREERSPSFFNIEEIMVVQHYVGEILESRIRGARIKQTEIGIIAPYRRQVQKIRKQFEKKNWKDVTVGSTEEFQGQERRVIIISTVRSNPEMLAMDSQYQLGFLRNPKRFNVAITRAKALLIVIGNPYILCRDQYWKALIQYCLSNEATTGTKFTIDAADTELDDIARRFGKLSLGPESDKVEISHRELYEGPQWKRADV